MITETITCIATNVLDRTSYAGAAGLMALESMIAPVPSEAVMPFVGFQVADGKWNFWLAITFVGATMWNTFLLVCGIKLREHWPTVQKYSHKIDVVIVFLILLAAIWWVKVRLPQFRA